MNLTIEILTQIAALGSGLLCGLFFVFSNFAMKALAELDMQGAHAMRAINRTILNPLFFLLFFGTAMTSLALLVVSLLEPNSAQSIITIASALLYLIGVMAVTVKFNVPMNNELEQNPTPEVWQRYLRKWVPWNHVRTLATLFAAAGFMISL